MTEAFSRNREFDFVQLDGLRRATGRPAHEWDLYIVKELIDNALDADETLWQVDPAQYPCVRVCMEYFNVPVPPSRRLDIRVSNRALFPVEQIDDIFATQWYSSRKAFFKGLTRGALGNALKTLLGIPYALRNRVAADWSPRAKPLAILCTGKEYLPRYIVDTIVQTLQFDCKVEPGRVAEGTIIRVGLDHFEQEMPRTLAQIEQLARQYHLCNPHVEFHWTVEIDEEDWTKTYEADPEWQSKFCGPAPVQWYPLPTFQDLLGALYRRQNHNQQGDNLAVEAVCRYFAETVEDNSRDKVKSIPVSAVIDVLGQTGLTVDDIESPIAVQFYQALCQFSPPVASSCLGQIGEAHIRSVLSQNLPLDGEIFYEVATDAGDNPDMPFVIEAAVVPLKEGKRQVWTALNFAPTYDDPFLRGRLSAPIQPDKPVLGLRGLLEAYSLPEDEPIFFFLHLICPNVEHNEFSKTEINHLPFKQVLGEMVDRLLAAVRQAREEAELRLEQVVFQALDSILKELEGDERFVLDQLLAKLRLRLSQDPTLATWLETPDAMTRLRAFIANYQSRNAVLTQHVARPAWGMISLPLHPDRHFSILAEHISRELLAQHHVSKVLLIQLQALEPVVIENNWLCRMDMALLHNTPGAEALSAALVQCVVSSELPILALHDANKAGQSLVEQMQSWLAERQLDCGRVIDLGLTGDPLEDGRQPVRLVELMPNELASWFIGRCEDLKLPIKMLPSDANIRRDIRHQFEQLLQGYFWEGVSQQFRMTRLIHHLDQELQLTEAIIQQALDRQLKDRLMRGAEAQSYTKVLKDLVESFFQEFMGQHSATVRKLVNQHMAYLRKKSEP